MGWIAIASISEVNLFFREPKDLDLELLSEDPGASAGCEGAFTVTFVHPIRSVNVCCMSPAKRKQNCKYV
jgi:hypothetical protein